MIHPIFDKGDGSGRNLCGSAIASQASLRIGWLILGALLLAGGGLNAQEIAPEKPVGMAQETEKAKTGVSGYKAMSLEDLMNQDVTSVAKQPEAFKNAAAAINVITQDEIRRSGASSIPEALRLADNLNVAQVNSSTWSISARGFNIGVGNKLLVLIDGRSVYSPLFSGVIWNMQDYLLEDLDRIEVISGPGGTLWGANAVNGVINIVTRSAKDTQGLYVDAGGGTWLEDFVGARYGGTLGSNVYFRVYGKYFDRGAEAFRNGDDAKDPWNRGQAGFRIDSYAIPQNLLTLEGDGFGGYNDVVPGGQGDAGGAREQRRGACDRALDPHVLRRFRNESASVLRSDPFDGALPVCGNNSGGGVGG